MEEYLLFRAQRETFERNDSSLLESKAFHQPKLPGVMNHGNDQHEMGELYRGGRVDTAGLSTVNAILLCI